MPEGTYGIDIQVLYEKISERRLQLGFAQYLLARSPCGERAQEEVVLHSNFLRSTAFGISIGLRRISLRATWSGPSGGHHAPLSSPLSPLPPPTNLDTAFSTRRRLSSTQFSCLVNPTRHPQLLQGRRRMWRSTGQAPGGTTDPQVYNSPTRFLAIGTLSRAAVAVGFVGCSHWTG